MSHDAIRIKVPVKVVQVVPAFEEKEQDETDDAEDYYATYYATNDRTRVAGGFGGSTRGRGRLDTYSRSSVYCSDRDAIA
jgi:hypothetical protein